MFSRYSGMSRIVLVPFAFAQDRSLKSMNEDWCAESLAMRFNCWTLAWREEQLHTWLVYAAPSARPYQLLGLAALVSLYIHLGAKR